MYENDYSKCSFNATAIQVDAVFEIIQIVTQMYFVYFRRQKKLH
jgi:hypothetical protein